MRVLFVGGTGIISSACTRLAVERGIELFVLNRGRRARPIPDSVTRLPADIRDPETARQAIGKLEFDAVVDWVAFTPEHVEIDLALFVGRTAQFIFISSASAYQTPPDSLPVTEETPLGNPIWQYSRDKIACEARLMRAFREDRFPCTIVRPSHTYDCTLSPPRGGWTVIERMRRGAPVVVHGDGSSVWTLTHHRDFATGLVGLLGRADAVGEAFHITSDEWLTWDRINRTLARAAGASVEIVHVPSDIIRRYDPAWGDSLLGDKTHSKIFDNSKIKRFVPDFEATIPFSAGAEEIIAWHDADSTRQTVDHPLDRTMDRIIADWRRSFPA